MGGKESDGQGEGRTADAAEKEALHIPGDKGINVSREGEDCKSCVTEDRRTGSLQASTSSGSLSLSQSSEQVMSPASSSSSSSLSTSATSPCQDSGSSEPGYVNYSRLHYRLQQLEAAEQNSGGERQLHKNLKAECFCQVRFDIFVLLNSFPRL